MSQDRILAVAELNGKYGCIDLQGKAIIPFKYDAIGFWSNGLIPVNKGAEGGRFLPEGGKWGYCDAKGVLKIALQFDEAQTFSEGLAAVSVDGKWGFINTQGDIVIQPVFKKAETFSEGLLAIKNEKRKWGFINKLGELVIDCKFDYAENFIDGTSRVFIGEVPEEDDEYGETEGLYGLIDTSGNYLCEPKYKYIWYFSEGFAKVEVQHPEKEFRKKSGFINKKGEEVIAPIYDYAQDFHEGLAAVGTITREEIPIGTYYSIGFIDTTGKEVIPQKFGSAYDFKNGISIVQKETIERPDKLKHAIIDKKGNIILDYQYFLEHIDTNLFIASGIKGFGKGLINTVGKVILPFEFINMSYLGEGLLRYQARFNKESGLADLKNGIVDINGKILFKTDEFEILGTDKEISIKYGLILGRIGRIHYKFGFVDTKGKWVIPPIYDSIGSFEKVN